MITSLSEGDKIHVGTSVTLTLLSIEGDQIRFGVQITGGSPGSIVRIEGESESGFNWWELN